MEIDEGSSFDLAGLGRRIREQRTMRRLSLDALASKSDVSRSMIAAVESGEKAPTVLVLHKIASGLNTSISRLLGDERSSDVIRLPYVEQVVARDPSGWERRNLAPVLSGVDFEFMRTSIPAGIDPGVFPPHAPGSREYVAVERGVLRLTIDGTRHDLMAGDAIFYFGDRNHGFSNPGSEECVYYLALEGGVGSSHHAVNNETDSRR